MYQRKKRLSIDDYVDGVLKGDKIVLSKAITLVESTLESDHLLAEQVIEKILPHTGNSIRIGITGVPGVGKSTFIESFGKLVTSRNKKLAVLAIDPSSQRSKGSILGDKTRMEKLSVDPLAYIRPSASGSSLGGVSTKTRETMLLCEAAGFEVIFIETVGVGQSETTVASMVDFFLVLMLAGAGDELQGIKKGVLELADTVAINKADGDNIEKAERARKEYDNALHFLSPSTPTWTVPVLTCSALTLTGVDTLWETIQDYRKRLSTTGELEEKRRRQALAWMWSRIEDGLKERFFDHPAINDRLPEIEASVERGDLSPTVGAETLLFLLDKNR